MELNITWLKSHSIYIKMKNVHYTVSQNMYKAYALKSYVPINKTNKTQHNISNTIYPILYFNSDLFQNKIKIHRLESQALILFG